MSSSSVGPSFHADPDDPDSDPQESRSVRFFSPPLVVSNRRVTLKKAAGIVLGASQKAISGAQLATGTGTMATTAALVTGAAVSATGIGLAAVAGAGAA